ncbi:MAG: hypothetical protein AB8U25_07300 [Rickettsiales endosymbiont of Dermacentor nuttalli]
MPLYNVQSSSNYNTMSLIIIPILTVGLVGIGYFTYKHFHNDYTAISNNIA